MTPAAALEGTPDLRCLRGASAGTACCTFCRSIVSCGAAAARWCGSTGPVVGRALGAGGRGASRPAFANMGRYFDAPALDDATVGRGSAARGRSSRGVDAGPDAPRRRQRHGTSPRSRGRRAAARRRRVAGGDGARAAAYGLEAVTAVFPDAGALRGPFVAVILLDVPEHVPEPRPPRAGARAARAGRRRRDRFAESRLDPLPSDRRRRPLPLAPIGRGSGSTTIVPTWRLQSARARRVLTQVGFEVVAEGQASPLVER